MKKQRKCLMKLFLSFVMALALCITSFGTSKVYATEGNSETVSITIDNSISHLAVQFYPDTNDLNNFEGISEGETKVVEVAKGSVVRMRLFIRANGHCLPDDYTIEGATKLTDDPKVNTGWCRAAFTMVADATKTVVIPEASVCSHPYADPNVRWGYYDCGDGTHAQACTLCASDIEGTVANHKLSQMTATEYADWYYNDSNFANMSEADKASRKTSMIGNITGKLGVDADTKINCCTVCEHFEKIDASSGIPGGSESASTGTVVTPSTPPVESEVTLPNGEEARMITVTGNSDVYVLGNPAYVPEGASFSSEAVTAGTTFDAAAKAIKNKYNASANFVVFEMNLTSASNQPIHQLGGYINVTLPIPSSITLDKNETIRAYRLETNGKLTKLDTAVANGQVTFATNHFSTYILVEENTMMSPKTGDMTNVMPILVMGIIIVTGMEVLKKRMIKL